MLHKSADQLIKRKRETVSEKKSTKHKKSSERESRVIGQEGGVEKEGEYGDNLKTD